MASAFSWRIDLSVHRRQERTHSHRGSKYRGDNSSDKMGDGTEPSIGERIAGGNVGVSNCNYGSIAWGCKDAFAGGHALWIRRNEADSSQSVRCLYRILVQ